ncbi:Heme/hemopexin transporter protein HuxB [Polaromonas vacuolata]|uniref:Heme/hemopexin transporter protein HuxB n=1 Tax=Polaromonas vacuolata TaxID=37448 RepID=A0A6H2HBZ3_9BURK|nr:ShlB/FhaC/HecB family hemolysin secretion/activation protein [Polaromonas vacuolata]QJC57114.1 Heme/hemopexin transporter protein HuxB [Polaromonas vacuolata]
MRSTISMALILTSLSPAFAQQAPSADSELQQIQNQTPSQPLKQDKEIKIEKDEPPSVLADEGIKINVTQLKINGTDFFSEAQLLATTGFIPNTEMSLTELRAMASKITEFLRSQGEFLAQTYLPPQNIENGVVQMTALLGQYGQFTLNNHSRLSDATANGILNGLSTGEKISAAPLERYLLLLSDLPGVSIKSVLTPGASVGTSDLVLDIDNTQRVNGSVGANNHGNVYSGKNRLDASININEPAGLGDVATLHVLSSGSGLNYARAAYQIQFGQARVGVAYSGLEYQLGKEFETAKLSGNAQIASLYGSYPLIRSRKQNLSAQLAYDSKRFEDKQNATTPGTRDEKKAQVIMASVTGDYNDGAEGFLRGNYVVTYTRGNIDLNTASVLANDAISAQRNGHFSKLNYSLTHQQNIASSVSLYASLSGQLASKNLDGSEKMSLGGANSVRAYPSGEANADQGYALTLEARKQLALGSIKNMQLIGFIDTGSVSINKNPWPAVTTPNHKTLSGTGIGLNWVSNNNLVIKAYYAVKIGNTAATSAPDASGRFWLQASFYF